MLKKVLTNLCGVRAVYPYYERMVLKGHQQKGTRLIHGKGKLRRTDFSPALWLHEEPGQPEAMDN